jgi:hypothetical protein
MATEGVVVVGGGGEVVFVFRYHPERRTSSHERGCSV